MHRHGQQFPQQRQRLRDLLRRQRPGHSREFRCVPRGHRLQRDRQVRHPLHRQAHGQELIRRIQRNRRHQHDREELRQARLDPRGHRQRSGQRQQAPLQAQHLQRREHRVRRAHRQHRDSASLLDRVSRFRIDRERRKECVPRRRRDKFVRVGHRDREVRRVRAAHREDFRLAPAGLDQNR